MGTKKTLFITLFVLCMAFCLNISSLSYAARNDIQSNTRTAILESFGNQPLLFIQNDGQLDKKVKYYEKGANHATYFTENGIYLNLFRQKNTPG
ncbi:MAG: hypothetical protein DRH93_05155, partial [Deltaproteobacteria bacterium]